MLVLKIYKYRHFTRFLQKKNGLNLASLSFLSSASSSITNAAQAAQSQNVNSAVNDTYGQPTASTHPHLINEGELVPGLTVEEFQTRRLGLMRGIQKFSRDNSNNDQCTSHLAIIPSSTKKYMSDKIPYVFRQNSDFYYLSGCLEPDTVLMMYIDEASNVKSILFMRPKDKQAELWDGPRTGVDNALDFFGVDETYSSQLFERELRRHIKDNKPQIWYDATISDLEKTTNDVRYVAGTRPLLNSPTKFVQSMRLFKSHSEQALMRRTCQIASDAINEVIKEARPGYSEHHIYAMVDYKCRMRNANYLAYPPVVASGNNATTIHYINNSQLMKSGDLVLMDAGCEYAGYTSDITRSWPINGVFSEPQKVLYDVILQLQGDLIALILQEGGETLDQLFETMCIKLGKYLQEIGVVSDCITDKQGYAKAGYKFCPHHVSHYLGMDVHDTPLLPRNVPLQPGMVFTIEPGIYISKDCEDVPKEFRGIGLRIEDDMLVNSNNEVEILSANCVKDRRELENLFKERRCSSV